VQEPLAPNFSALRLRLRADPNRVVPDAQNLRAGHGALSPCEKPSIVSASAHLKRLASFLPNPVTAAIARRASRGSDALP